jgi:hypothetical protein
LFFMEDILFWGGVISCYKDTTYQASKQASKIRKISLFEADFWKKRAVERKRMIFSAFLLILRDQATVKLVGVIRWRESKLTLKSFLACLICADD